jgi:hypothetical protein
MNADQSESKKCCPRDVFVPEWKHTFNVLTLQCHRYKKCLTQHPVIAIVNNELTSGINSNCVLCAFESMTVISSDKILRMKWWRTKFYYWWPAVKQTTADYVQRQGGKNIMQWKPSKLYLRILLSKKCALETSENYRRNSRVSSEHGLNTNDVWRGWMVIEMETTMAN